MERAQQRIADVFNGQLRPVDGQQPILTSASTPWAGFLIERDACRPGCADSIVYRHDQLIFITSGTVTVRDRALPGADEVAAPAGSVTTWPSGHECRSVYWTSRGRLGGLAEMIRVQVDQETLQRLTIERCGPLHGHLAPCVGASDAPLSSLAQLMAAEVAAECPNGPLYSESLCLAFAARVYSGPAAAAAQPAKGALSRAQLTRVCDYIDHHLGSDLSLVDLAAQAGLSPRHFALRFRRSTNVTPHQYVLARRVERAQQLLLKREARAVDVALALGFSSQSHFIDVFHRTVGVTPRQFQRTG